MASDRFQAVAVYCGGYAVTYGVTRYGLDYSLLVAVGFGLLAGLLAQARFLTYIEQEEGERDG